MIWNIFVRVRKFIKVRFVREVLCVGRMKPIKLDSISSNYY